MEISLVSFPANGNARVASVKSAAGDFSDRDFEQLMQDAGSAELDDLAAAIKRNTHLFATT